MWTGSGAAIICGFTPKRETNYTSIVRYGYHRQTRTCQDKMLLALALDSGNKQDNGGPGCVVCLGRYDWANPDFYLPAGWSGNTLWPRFSNLIARTALQEDSWGMGEDRHRFN